MTTTGASAELRVCYVGASHMVAHKLGADEVGAPRGVRLAFHGLAGQEFFAIEARDDHLGLNTDRLVAPQAKKPLWPSLDAVVPYHAHDVFVVVGTIKTWQLVEATRMLSADEPPYSQRYLIAGMEGMVKTDHGLRLAARISEASGKPTFFVAPPLPAEPLAVGASEPRRAYESVLALLKDACASRGVTFVPQPEETLLDWGATREEFARGSIAYTGERHRADERKHMNARFGAIALAAVIDAVQRPHPTARSTAAA